MMQRTFVIFKPDAMEQGLVGSVLNRFETAQLRLGAAKMIQLDETILRQHYAHLTDEPFFGSIVVYMSSCPVLIAVLEGEDAVARVREITGPTDSAAAPRGTIRGDFGKDKSRNVLHASDSPESAQKEIKRFFSPKEIF
jgi:nucleoside-diphosphate kinase